MTVHASAMPSIVDPAHLGLDEVQRAERGAGPGVLAVGRDDDDVAVAAHRPGEDVQADGVDPVVVGHQQAWHVRQSASRVVPIGSDLRT